MRIVFVELLLIRVPFRRTFEHASAQRSHSENVLIHCVAASGAEGWGETIARKYVTGENTTGVVEKIRGMKLGLWTREFVTASDVTDFCSDAALDGSVARCAVEIALLDCLAREKGLPLARFLSASWPELASIQDKPPIKYSGPLDLGSGAKTLTNAIKIRLFGFSAVKLKLSGRLRDDVRNLRLARFALGSNIDLRVDANESWSQDYTSGIAAALRRARVSAVEQPFPRDRLDWAAEFSVRTGIPLIFDESLCSEQDAFKIAALGLPSLFAVKLAKIGGFWPTLRVAAVARGRGIPVQIGCQVGESAVLSAAGRHLASVCPELRYLEGSYDAFLLSSNVIDGNVSFGWGGRAPALDGPGLGIDVDNERVSKMVMSRFDLFGRA